MTTDVKYNEYAKELLEQLPKGAFLTVKAGDKLNTMTIGWGAPAFIWQKPIFLVLVRYSRYTYQLLEQAREFTVSIPINKDMKKALAFCGTKSGREVDKFKEANLTAEPAKVVNTPIIGECDLHYECKVVYQQAMEPAILADHIKTSAYPKGDYHVMYFGEIVACYKKE
ncbi:flavin reductase family protein [Desulfotomaculum nigrificans]|uniref:flavin reductase family protein n=1 Tax=Desulfotomaculum nigrificans TaxID=1565 RepID=UPI0001FAE90A|nr:flavin reductase family protein [Desulfotomaculum nigrificans]